MLFAPKEKGRSPTAHGVFSQTPAQISSPPDDQDPTAQMDSPTLPKGSTVLAA